LLEKGHSAEVCYSSKDVLEDLIKSEEWNNKNLFPDGRKIKGLPAIVSAGIYFFLTIWKLLVYTREKKYDLFVTDDVLGVVGKIRKVPTIHFADDDYSLLHTSRFLFKFVTYILTPNCTDMGKFEYKKIGFRGFKQSAYLRPSQFEPDHEILKMFNPEMGKFFILRIVSLAAAHDIGKKGIDDITLIKLISILEKYGQVFISSERNLPSQVEKYKIKIKPYLILHVISFADILITDSQSMSLEAGMLGTPFIRFNSFIDKISVLDEMENKYQLGFGVKSNDPQKLFEKLNSLLECKDLKDKWKLRRKRMLDETIDLSAFMFWLLDNYPSSLITLNNQKDYQIRFI
jgi:uncharacterized protein